MIIKHVAYIPLSDVVKFLNTAENVITMRNLLEKYQGYLVDNVDDFLDNQLSCAFKDILFDNSKSKTTMLQNIKTLVNNCDDWYLILKIGYGGDFEITNPYDYKSYNEDDVINALSCSVGFSEVFQIFKNTQKRFIFEEC